MHSTGSLILTILQKVRFLTEEATLDAKYNNDYLLRYFIQPAMVSVLSRINLNADDPIVMRHQIDLEASQQYYQLPPTIQEIWRFAIMDEFGNITGDAKPRGEFNPIGPGWAIEGNTLSIRPFPVQDATTTAHIWYVPNADVCLNYHSGLENGVATGGAAVNADGTQVTLSANPNTGSIDRRPNAYAGFYVRMLSHSSGAMPMDERIISNYDPVTRVCTLRIPLSSDWWGKTNCSYEVVPAWSQALVEAISVTAALEISIGRKMSAQQLENLKLQYRIGMKTLKDNANFKQLRTGKAFMKNTVDNPGNHWGAWSLWGYWGNQ